MTTKSEIKEKQGLLEELEQLRERMRFLESRHLETEKKEAEWLSRITSLQNIIDSPSAVSIIVTNLEGDILIWNRGAENMLGYTAEEIVNKEKISILYPEDGDTREVVREVVNHIITEKKGITCEVEERHKNGHKLWVRLTLSPRFDEHGQLTGILGIGENATERKQAEAALAERSTLAAYSARIGNALVESSSMQEVLTKCVDITSHYIGVCSARLWVNFKDENILELQTQASHDLFSNPPVLSGHLEIDPLGQIASAKKPFRSNEAKTDPQLAQYSNWIARTGILSFGAYPLVLEHRVIGLLEVFSKKEISEALHHTLSTAADEISLGIDRVRTFDALQASEQRIRSIVDNSLEGLITFFANGTITTFNPAAEDIFSYSSDEAMSRSLKWVLPNLCNDEGTINKEMLSGPQCIVGRLVEETGMDKRGRVFPIDLAISELKLPERRKSNRNDHGLRPALYIAMVRDITQRKGFEEALRNQSDYTMRIIERTPALVVGLGLDGKTQFVNPAVERITGYLATELIGQHWWHTLLPKNEYQQTEILFEVMAAGPVRNHEMVITTKEGNRRVVAWSNIQRLGEQGELVENIGFGIDVTEQKHVERELIRAARQAEESNRLKSDFLSIISHELRTPLTVMLGSTPLMFEKDDLPEPEEIVNIVRDIDRSGKHLLALIDDLLDFSKVEAGKMDLHLEWFPVEAFLQQLIIAFQMIAQNKEIDLRCDTEDFEVKADKIRLKQIIYNLLSNAIKFTDKGTVSLRAHKQGEVAVFEIEDTGCGISEENLLFIFDVFRQVDASTTRAASGTGLGLAITKELVELHRGKISAESQVEKGSIFRFTLPLS